MENSQLAKQVAKAVGRSRMAEALDVGPTMISKAVVAGKFPPSWFLVMQSLCSDADIKCPPSLFGMKSTDGEVRGNPLGKLQPCDPKNIGGAA